MDELLTLAEAAKLLKIKNRILYSRLKRRLMRGKKIGGQWRFTKSKITEIIDRTKELLTAKEAAKILGTSVSFLYKLAREGGVFTMRIGRSLRFSKKEIAEINNRRKKGA